MYNPRPISGLLSYLARRWFALSTHIVTLSTVSIVLMWTAPTVDLADHTDMRPPPTAAAELATIASSTPASTASPTPTPTQAPTPAVTPAAPRVLGVLPLVTVACGRAAGPRLSEPFAMNLLERFDWRPYEAATMLEVFRRASGLYMGVVSCTRDFGWTQVNAVHADTCDLGLALQDPYYATACAHDVFEAQGIRAWYEAEGWLW